MEALVLFCVKFISTLVGALFVMWLAFEVLTSFEMRTYAKERRVRKAKFEIWFLRRQHGTWWEQSNMAKHVERIASEGPFTGYRGPWEEDIKDDEI